MEKAQSAIMLADEVHGLAIVSDLESVLISLACLGKSQSVDTAAFACTFHLG